MRQCKRVPMPPRDVIRAAGYARVSTEEQAREGYGLDAQRTQIETYCKLQGWQLVDVYVDAGVSGSSLKKRDALARLLAAADGHALDRVVFWKLDRLSRSLRDVLDLSDRLEKAGVKIVSIQEGIDAGTPTGRLYRNILGTLAEFERETITERIKEALAEKARQGELLGPLPLGYRRADDGAIALAETIAPLIRQAFERYATGRYSLRDLAAWANSAGLRSTGGRAIDRLSIGKTLRNVTYTGAVAHHRRRGGALVVRDAHDPIVSRELFERVQACLNARRRDGASNPRPFGKMPYPLSRIATCATCHAPLLGSMSGRRLRYMRCSTAARHGRAACRQPMVRAGLLEAQVAAYMSGIKLPKKAMDDITSQYLARQGREPDEIRRLRKELERWRRLYVAEDIDDARYRRETEPLHRAIAAAQPATTTNVIELARYLQSVGHLFAKSELHEQRRFIQEVFAQLVVDREQLVELHPKPQYAALFVADRYERFGGDMCVIWLPGQDSNLQPCG
ncbi:MAG: recombinase family protein [Dehalococcoidia bacterium]